MSLEISLELSRRTSESAFVDLSDTDHAVCYMTAWQAALYGLRPQTRRQLGAPCVLTVERRERECLPRRPVWQV